jgi:hypothetical protein
MAERHGWLREALADRGLAAADAARAWGVHDAVLVRFIKTGEPKITAFRVAALVELLDMPRTELLARLGERPVHFAELHDQPLSIVAGFAAALGMSVEDVLTRLEKKPARRRKEETTDEFGGW